MRREKLRQRIHLVDVANEEKKRERERERESSYAFESPSTYDEWACAELAFWNEVSVANTVNSRPLIQMLAKLAHFLVQLSCLCFLFIHEDNILIWLFSHSSLLSLSLSLSLVVKHTRSHHRRNGIISFSLFLSLSSFWIDQYDLVFLDVVKEKQKENNYSLKFEWNGSFWA